VNILLDTHAFLWFVGKDARLSAGAQALIADPQNEPFLSLVSCWEIAIKSSIGKLSLTDSFEVFIPQQLLANRIQVLEITLPHLAAVNTLPFQQNHHDPFDRLLIAQAMVERMPFVSNEALFAAYPITRLW